MKRERIQKGVFIMENSVEYNIGFVIGLVVAIGAAVLFLSYIAKKNNTNGRLRTEYDERQKLEVGKGYKIGYWTLLGYLALVMAADSVAAGNGAELPADFGVLAFTGIIISIMVFCTYCIMTEAYWGLNNNRNRYVILLAAIGIINLVLAILSIIRGDMIIDGKLQGSFINLLCAVLMAEVLAADLIKRISDKNKEVTDDEE